MKIHARLLFSYMAMIIIPFILSVIAIVIILGMQMGHYNHKYNLGPGFVKIISETAARVSKEVDTVSLKKPDKLKDMIYLEKLSNELLPINSGIVVKSGEKFIYISKNLEKINVKEKIDQIQRRDDGNFSAFTLGDELYTVKINQFTFSDKSNGTSYLVSDVSAVGKFFGILFSKLSIAIILIIIFTTGIITFLMSRSITKPLQVLMGATNEIKNGNLNFQVKSDSKDELGELTVAFEQMRSKLKASIDLQLQYEENRKELVSSISHDLKTPITAIKGYVEGIVDGVADTPEKMDKYINTIYSKATDMDKMIDDLFLFSKLDLKKMPFSFEKVDVSKYFEDCVSEVQLDLEEKGIDISLSKPATEHIIVSIDREKLKRVILNIIDNSAKYMGKESGKIKLSLEEKPDEVIVDIKDNGKGISPDELPHIFDRFYRADPSRNTSTGGSGLGLAIVKQIVEGHGGQIWAESKLGEGTDIYFTLKKVPIRLEA